MKTSTKRFLSMLMAVVMIVTLLPVSALAETLSGELGLGGVETQEEKVALTVGCLVQNTSGGFDVKHSATMEATPGDGAYSYIESYVTAWDTEFAEGFTRASYDLNPAVAIDGSTAIEVRYNRDLVNLTFTVGNISKTVLAYAGETLVKPVMIDETTDANIVWTPALPEAAPATDTIYAGVLNPMPTAPYKVFCWVEGSTEGEYSFFESETVTPGGEVGSEIELADSYKSVNKLGSDKDKYVYFSCDSGKVIAKDGSTIVNVYFERKQYTITFHEFKEYTCTKEEHSHTSKPYSSAKNNKNQTVGCWTSKVSGNNWSWVRTCEKDEHTHSSRCYTTKDYTITAKWGQDVSNKWPGGSWHVNKYESRSDPAQAFIELMPVGGKDFYRQDSGSYSYSAEYYIEKLDIPGNYDLHHTDSFESQSSSLRISEEDEYKIQGFTFDHYVRRTEERAPCNQRRLINKNSPFNWESFFVILYACC